MTSPQLLARLSGLQQMMRDLLRGVPAAHANRRFDPRLASLGWYLGRSVYRETYWLREVVTGDTDLTARVRPLFTPSAMDPELQSARLPPPDHLLSWAAEIQDEHCTSAVTGRSAGTALGSGDPPICSPTRRSPGSPDTRRRHLPPGLPSWPGT